MNGKVMGATVASLAAVLMGGVLAGPASAAGWENRQATQNNKNTARNIGIGLGAAAIYEAVQGKGTNALLLGAGAALAGSQYEKDRKAQNDDWSRDRYGRYDRDNRYDRRDDHRFDRHDDRWNNRDDHRYGHDNRYGRDWRDDHHR